MSKYLFYQKQKSSVKDEKSSFFKPYKSKGKWFIIKVSIWEKKKDY